MKIRLHTLRQMIDNDLCMKIKDPVNAEDALRHL